MRVVLADDSTLLREGLSLILADAQHEIVTTVGDGDALREAALTHRPDLIISDVRMPPRGDDEGLRAAVEIRHQWPQAPILMLSQYIVTTYAEELFASGSGGVGYLLKDRVADIDQFLAALETVASGGAVLDPSVVQQLMRRRPDPISTLTARETDVLALMAQGLTNAAIAAELVVTEGAVEKHSQRIFAKLELSPDQSQHRRVQAVLRYLNANAG